MWSSPQTQDAIEKPKKVTEAWTSAHAAVAKVDAYRDALYLLETKPYPDVIDWLKKRLKASQQVVDDFKAARKI